MARADHLTDTNILLRLIKSNDPEFRLVRGAVHALQGRGNRLCYIPQNMLEFLERLYPSSGRKRIRALPNGG